MGKGKERKTARRGVKVIGYRLGEPKTGIRAEEKRRWWRVAKGKVNCLTPRNHMLGTAAHSVYRPNRKEDLWDMCLNLK